MTFQKNQDLSEIWRQANQRGAADFSLIRAAEIFAQKVHQNEKRDGGAQFITHPWAVARILLDLNLGTDIVAAGLLHDVMERGITYEELKSKFNTHIADMVGALTIKQDNSLSKEENDEYYNEVLVERIQQNYEIGYLKIAGRIHNLHMIQYQEEQKRRKKIQETKDTLIPLTEELEMNYLGILLKDACLQAEIPDLYQSISDKYTGLLNDNKRAMKNFAYEMKNFILGAINEKSEELQMIRHYIYDLRITECLPYQLFVKLRDNRLETGDIAKLTKHMLFLQDMDLIMKDECPLRKLSCFLKIYENVLIHKGVLITDIKRKEASEVYNISLEDRYENRYRLFLHSQTSFTEYMYGSDYNRNAGLVYRKKRLDITERYPAIRKITVKTKDGDDVKIAEGATVLDFAFQIHEEVGLSAVCGRQRGTKLSLNTRLNEGDIIEIETLKNENGELVPCPRIKWFGYVRTQRAMRYLMGWFEKRYEKT